MFHTSLYNDEAAESVCSSPHKDCSAHSSAKQRNHFVQAVNSQSFTWSSTIIIVCNMPWHLCLINVLCGNSSSTLL